MQATPKQTYTDWKTVLKTLKTRTSWRYRFRSVNKNETATAMIALRESTKYHSFDGTKTSEITFALFSIDQTTEMKKTDLAIAKRQFFELFVKPSDRTKYIRWSRGGYAIDELTRERYWDDSIADEGWRYMANRSLSFQDVESHLTGSQLFGVFGSKKSRYLTLDVDLHNSTVDLFWLRLEVLVERFYATNACHFHVSDQKAGGIHIILVSSYPTSLESKHKWMKNQLLALHSLFPACEFIKNGKVNIEVYPNSSRGIRLPLARERTMLLDKPLPPIFRSKRFFPDVAAYMRWLNDLHRTYMPKAEVLSFMEDRLDYSLADFGPKDSARSNSLSPEESVLITGQESFDPKVPISQIQVLDPNLAIRLAESFGSKTRNGKSNRSGKSFGSKDLEDQTKGLLDNANSGGLKGRLRGVLINFWIHNTRYSFKNINAAIFTTLQGLRAEGLLIDTAINILETYVDELTNPDLSSRLIDDRQAISQVIKRTANRIWRTAINTKWRNVNLSLSRYGFKVSDKSTWTFKNAIRDVVVDCNEVTFTDQETEFLIQNMVPVLVRAKQISKPEAQLEVISLMAFFLRYVRCCDREIPVSALPSILKKFNVKMGNHDKQTEFLKLLVKWKWLKITKDYSHPKKQGGSKPENKARKYEVGKAMMSKFT